MESNFAKPSEFIPEGWLDDRDPEFEHDDRKEVFQQFSVGPRNCIERNLAYAEMRVILAKLLWRFDLAIPSESALSMVGEESGREGWRLWTQKQKS